MPTTDNHATQADLLTYKLKQRPGAELQLDNFDDQT
jgi:hypothetical protein